MEITTVALLTLVVISVILRLGHCDKEIETKPNVKMQKMRTGNTCKLKISTPMTEIVTN